MGRKVTPGLRKRGNIWHIEKRVFGQRLRESTGSELLSEAESFLARQVEKLRQANIYGVRPKRLFKEAATHFLMKNQHKRSISDDALLIKKLIPFIGKFTLETIHMGSLEPFIEARKEDGVKNQTINHSLQIVRHILKLAAHKWRDENGKTWLEHAPVIELLPKLDEQKPYPLSWEEQHRLFAELPPHLKSMASFAVNTGCRVHEICQLRWEWELKVLEMPEIMLFLVPKQFVKNGQDHLVICNKIARSVIEAQRGQHPEFVFIYKNKPLQDMLNSAWIKARKRAGLPQVRVHDLKHTLGRRLRAAEVCFEDRQDLLGHKSSRITTHYSVAELYNLYQAANKACEEGRKGVVLTLVRANPQIQSPILNQGTVVDDQCLMPTKCPQRVLKGV